MSAAGDKAAILFPGQGAQALGMGLDLAAAEPSAAACLELAEEVLELPLREILAGEDKAALDRTDVCQPAILAVSLAAMAALDARGLLRRDDVAACAGLSLGEYTALTWAGALTPEAALRLVRRRGQAMQAASEERDSGMLSLVGATPETATALCDAARGDGVLVLANLLAPGQIAIAGTTDALERAAGLAREHRVRKAVPLAVAGAFHSPCMESAGAKLVEALQATEFSAPRIPVVLNTTGRATQDPGEIVEQLKRQIISPVLWQASMEALIADGVRQFLEPAPGKQLTNMLRRYDVETRSTSCADAEALQSLQPWPGDAG